VFRIYYLGQQGCVGSARTRLRLGALLELGQSYAGSRTLLRLARPLLALLAEQSGESVHLAELRGFEVVHLDGEQVAQLVQTGLRVGSTLPCHCTALGKVLLGCGPAERQERYDRELVVRGLARRTPETLVDRDKLVEHLHAVAAQGFAVDREECEAGLSCAAAPVYDASGKLVAAISISAPAFRLPERRLQASAVPAVVAAAQQLSRQLGYAA
jgi:IclR family acetate operon transcriptional repressor